MEAPHYHESAQAQYDRLYMGHAADLPASIRAATCDDDPFLVQLAARLADFDLPAWRTGQEIASADARAMLAAVRARQRDDEVFVAERDGTPVGCLHVVAATDFFGRRHAHISVLATIAAAEGSGIGRALMAHAEDWARARGYSLITLNVFAANTRARRFYEGTGFSPEVLKYAKPL
ncbi:MAG: GNAT family N-acetyltransferase [Nitrososphaerales archaeon]